ncbi:MAG: tRNA pseudouridine(38-40) synthase TruA [Proteobacteria bacterium]|nr:tRNA pseudouridine(38-40) synthase TruA [Pseudomonadota bacterium]MBU4131698.1 tRNA pseudouridine(38-40) synthase TruA [Pseudomonadota bacterium]
MKQYYYLIHLQYLGFRYHGWQKQPGVKTIESMVEKTVFFVLGHRQFKVLGTSRTDTMVSAQHSAFELFTTAPLDTKLLLEALNLNLPNDIRVFKIEAVDKKFNIRNTPKTKEYLYLFSFGEKCHPFCAPLMGTFQDHLDIELMKKGAQLFLGVQDFKRYCTKPMPGTQFKREILVSQVEENTFFSASFFPKQSFAYRIQSKGFLRNQVRLMMGQLLRLGKQEICLEDITETLTGIGSQPLRQIAPPSGLILHKIEFDHTPAIFVL